MKEFSDMATPRDPNSQIRALYRSLLERQSNFDEFKTLLALYPASLPPNGQETAEAMIVRAKLNSRISEWLGDPFDALTAEQLLQWRAIVVEERFNNVLSPWNESNVW
jgi:hypothetical protein